jgi:hypothetical protein
MQMSCEFPHGGFGEPERWFCVEREYNFEYHFKNYATQALSKCDEFVVTLDPDWSALKWIADFGLSAAVNHPDLRYPLYVRYCAAMYYSPDGRAEGVHNVFKLFVRREFPTVDWDRFREDMRVVMFRGKDVAAYRNGVTDHTQSPLVEATTEGQTPPAG